MTKKTSRARSTSAASKHQRTRLNQIIFVTVAVALLLLAAYFVLTGSDPLGLFGQDETTPTARTVSSAVVGSGGDWWHVYFTDPQQAGDPDNLTGTVPGKLIDHINAAQRTIHIAAFEFNLTPVAEALISAHKRGVKVQWITDDEHGIEADEEKGHGQFVMLKKAGIQVKDDDRSALMHNKFWVFDGQTVWTGSTNITTNGSFRNNNNAIVIESSTVAAIYEREFSEMWGGEFGPTSSSTADDQTTTVDRTLIQVLFAAEDDVVSRLIPLIDGAQSSIRFMAFSFTHDDMGAAVLARAKAGVDVKGIFETRGSETEYSEMPALYCAGVAVRQDGNPGTFHHKVFVIDDQTVITGSLNFSNNADDSNDENVIIITRRDIAAQYLQEFERRWAEASEPNAADMDCK